MAITTAEIIELQQRTAYMSLEETMALQEQYGAHNYRPLPFAPTYGEGPWVWDANGRRVLDFNACYSSLGEGHNPSGHKEIKLSRLLTNRVPLIPQHVYSPERSVFLKVLAEMLGMDKVLPTVDGVGAMETTWKAALRWTAEVKKVKGNLETIVAEDCFHGRTRAAISASSDPNYRRGFDPLVPGYIHVPFGDVDAIREKITSQTAAVCIESKIQAEGGIKVAPEGYLTEVRQLCDEANVLLIYDEVQVGLGRLGYLCGYMCEGDQAKPDLIALAKFLGGGMSIISAVAGRADVIGVFDEGSHGSTFGGNPEACALATKTLEDLSRPEFLQHVREMGNVFRSFLYSLKEKSNLIVDVRGMGLLWGIEFAEEIARHFVERLLEEGIWCYTAHSKVIRFSPPLNITLDDLNEAEAFEKIERVILAR